MVPHALPDAAGLAQLAAGLPLTVEAVADEPELYLALLRVQQSCVYFCTRSVQTPCALSCDMN